VLPRTPHHSKNFSVLTIIVCWVSTRNDTCYTDNDKNRLKLEGCIDNEHQFKMAKRSRGLLVYFSSTSAWWRYCSETVFRDNFVIFRLRLKRIAFWNQWIFLCVCMQIFNFRDGHVTTFQHPSGTYAICLWHFRAKCLVTDSPD